MNKHIRRWAVVCGLGFAACSPFSGSAVAQVSPFYESTPTGRTDDNGRPELDRFGAPESSSAIGISIPIGGPSRDLTPGVDDEREPADPPTEVSGAFSLKGMVRGEDLEAALRSVLASASRGEETPLELYDPAYDRYVNMSSLGTAWRSQDPAALADGALQLLEGERILLRPHAKLPADKVLILAGKLATEKQDGATLERLKKAAELHGKKEAAAQLAASGKLGAAARGDEGMTISIGETTPEEYQVCSSYLARIRTAKIAGDAAGLKNLQTELASQTRLQPQRREQLLAQVQKIAAALPKDKAPDPALEALSKLAGNSRDYTDSWAIESSGPMRSMCYVYNSLRRPAMIYVNTRGHWMPVTIGAMQRMDVSVPSTIQFHNGFGETRQINSVVNKQYTLYIANDGALEARW